MNCFKYLLICVLFFQCTMAQKYIAVAADSKIGFTIKNIGINVNGTFTGVDGSFVFDKSNLSRCKINMSVPATSITTDNKSRDKHLRQSEYFDVAQFENINFESSKFEAAARLNRFMVTGVLTIKGISRPLTFELFITEKDQKLELKSVFDINRRTFKVGDKSLILSDNVKMNVNVVCGK